ncbi:MAG: hypothetical protein HYX91_01705 [Chloroflexi bacterium]|nr:hypothetical protein [Chloroflexota bacterium]
MRPAGLITVRTGSSRLKDKCLLSFGEGNVIEHIIRRARYSGFEPMVCTTTLAEDDIIEETARREGCPVYRGSVKDKLERWLDACQEFDISAVHTIDADDPFFDGPLGHQSFRLLQQGYDIVYPSSRVFIGGVGFSLTRDVMARACALKQSDDTEMMWYFMEKVPGLRRTELPVAEAGTARIRLTLDYEEDYWLLCTVLRVLGPLAGRAEIEDLFARNPDLHRVNWFRNDEWKRLQQEKGKAAVEASDV